MTRTYREVAYEALRRADKLRIRVSVFYGKAAGRTQSPAASTQRLAHIVRRYGAGQPTGQAQSPLSGSDSSYQSVEASATKSIHA